MADAALATRVAELEAEVGELRRAETLQRALYEIAALSTADSPEQEHYARLHQIVGRLMDARNFIIATYDAEAGMIHQQYMVDEDPTEAMSSFPYGEGISSLVIRSRRPWLMGHALFEELVAAGEIRAPRGTVDFHSWMGAPLIAQDHVYGLIIVQSYTDQVTYTPADLDLLNYVASHVAATVARWQANSALKEAMQAQVAAAETLRLVGDIGKDLTGRLDSLSICRTLEKHVSALVPTDVFGVALLAASGDALEYVHYVEDGVVDEPSAFPLDHPTSLAALTFRADREMTLFNEAQLRRAPSGSANARSAPVLSAIFKPLVANGRRIGVVTVQSHAENAYGERELEVFRSATSYAAIALANADAFAAAENARLQTAQALEDLHQAEAHLVHSEKMAALGQVIAGVAHEINTPIGAIKSSGQNIAAAMAGTLPTLPGLMDSLAIDDRRRFAELVAHASRPRALTSTREERAMVREVAARLEGMDVPQARHRAGLLVQLQAHADLDAVLPLLRHPLAERILDAALGIATIATNTDNINTAVERVGKIVFALRSFSRFGGSQVWVETDLAQCLETVLTIYHHQIKQGTELVRRYDPDVPPVRCLPDELNQVWTNLIHNALQAMDYRGTLALGLVRDGEHVRVSVGDTGCGIAPALRERIFDAFFTTKPAGEGTGLGLDIVRRIVQRHGGTIELESDMGRGSTFTVVLPIAGAE